MKIIPVCALVLSAVIARASDVSLPSFLDRESDASLAREAAKQRTFFLRLVVGGMAGVENASYELIYSGDPKNLDLLRGDEVSGTLIRRDQKGQEVISVEKHDLARLVSDCINEELFELGVRMKNVTAPDLHKMDEGQVWLFIKYGEVENILWRTDDSLPVWRTYLRLKKLIGPKPSEGMQGEVPSPLIEQTPRRL